MNSNKKTLIHTYEHATCISPHTPDKEPISIGLFDNELNISLCRELIDLTLTPHAMKNVRELLYEENEFDFPESRIFNGTGFLYSYRDLRHQPTVDTLWKQNDFRVTTTILINCLQFMHENSQSLTLLRTSHNSPIVIHTTTTNDDVSEQLLFIKCVDEANIFNKPFTQDSSGSWHLA